MNIDDATLIFVLVLIFILAVFAVFGIFMGIDEGRLRERIKDLERLKRQ